MTKNVQHPRGTTAAEDSITGLVGQLRVDTERRELRLHDGATPGGMVIPNNTTVGELVASAIADAGVGVQANIHIAASAAALAALTPSLYAIAILNTDTYAALYTWVNNATYYNALHGHIASTVTPGTYWRPVVNGADVLLIDGTDATEGTARWDLPVGMTIMASIIYAPDTYDYNLALQKDTSLLSGYYVEGAGGNTSTAHTAFLHRNINQEGTLDQLFYDKDSNQYIYTYNEGANCEALVGTWTCRGVTVTVPEGETDGFFVSGTYQRVA